MNERDRETFVQLMQAMASTFGRDCDEPMLIGYWMALQDLPIENVKRAATRAIRECDWMPPGSKLRNLAGVMTDEARSLLAWYVASNAVTSEGRYRHVDFDDCIINATIRTLGGWVPFIDRFSRDREEFIQRDFEKAYRSLYSAGVNGEITRPLAGLSDAEVVRGSLRTPTPVRITTGLPEPTQRAITATTLESRGIPIVRLPSPMDLPMTGNEA